MLLVGRQTRTFLKHVIQSKGWVRALTVVCLLCCAAGPWCGHELSGSPHGWRHSRWQAQLLSLGPQLQGKEDTQEAQGQQQVDFAAAYQARLSLWLGSANVAVRYK